MKRVMRGVDFRASRLARVTMMVAIATVLACDRDEPTAPQTPLGTFALAYVRGVAMPAMVKDPPTQAWIGYSAGSLVLRADSTYTMQIDARFRDFPDAVIDGRHVGRFHWSRDNGAFQLLDASGEVSYYGTATADTVAIYCRFFPCSVPFPDEAPHLTFARR